MSGTPVRASRWCRGLGEARGRPSCLKLEEEEQVGEDLGGEFLAPRKKMKSSRCSSSASSDDAPARWRGFNGGGEGEAPPWLGVRERERVV